MSADVVSISYSLKWQLHCAIPSLPSLVDVNLGDMLYEFALETCHFILAGPAYSISLHLTTCHICLSVCWPLSDWGPVASIMGVRMVSPGVQGSVCN